jgi:diaminopimelate decarboxylase
MAGFHVERGSLCCDGIPLDEIARAVGTPVHVMSGALLAERYRELDAAFGDYPHRLHYALKANSTLAIVRRLRALGAGADANSGGEIDVALRAGVPPQDIVFTGVGKTPAEIDRAVALGLGVINVESEGEAARIAGAAEARRTPARVAVRVNPDVDAGTHPHISTGARMNKFGVAPDVARSLMAAAARHPWLRPVGLHVHVGSQLTRPEPVARAVAVAVRLAQALVRDGVGLEHLDVGGGLGIPYQPGQPVMSAADYAAAVLDCVRPTGLALLLEPGRWIAGPAGVLVTRVVDVKPQTDDDTAFVVVDAGMTDLMRPALYGAWHGIEPVTPREGRTRPCDVVGPVCETADTFGTRRDLPPVDAGDLMAIRDTGAYGSVMASNYNRRPVAAEVLVEHGTWQLIRRRQTIDDMLQWDV